MNSARLRLSLPAIRSSVPGPTWFASSWITKLFYRLPIESGRWQAVGSVRWGEGDPDVAFHDSEIFMINAGVMYRFGAR